MSLLVFTDLDGTLLDHDTYSHAPADATLARLRDADVPVILTSSKTAVEMRAIREELGLRGHPFVSENGSVVHIPEGPWSRSGRDETLVLGAGYDVIRDALVATRSAMAVEARGFGDMDAQEVADLTGLPLRDAEAARAREASEPVVFEGDEAAFERFAEAIAARGLRTTRGGRFVHVMGDTDKGSPVPLLAERYAAARSARPVTVGLGDGENDRPLLDAVDVAVVIRPAHRAPLRLERDDALVTESSGPAGWAAALDVILARHLGSSGGAAHG